MKITEFEILDIPEYPNIKASFSVELSCGTIREFKLLLSKRGHIFFSYPSKKNKNDIPPTYINIYEPPPDQEKDFKLKVLTLLEPYFKEIDW